MSKEVNEERTPRIVEDVKEMLSKHSNGEIQRTIQNCITILQNDHVLADAIRLNLLSERIDIVKPVGWPRSGKTLNDIDMKYILRRMEKYGIPIEKKIEMSEMIATANAKSIEEIKSFLSKQKETYKVPYETHPADRLRQCVFAGTTNRQDFLPRDRTGNRRFIPIPVDAELAEVHILDNEAESRAYIDQLWAEAMTIYNSGNYKLAFSPAMQETLHAHQQDFMQEDTQAGMIYAFLEDYTGDRVCSKQLYAEALGNTNIPAEWETRAICEIMNTGISRGDIQGWQAHKTAKRYPKYGVQKGWERVTSPETGAEDFSEITDAEAKQLGFPF